MSDFLAIVEAAGEPHCFSGWDIGTALAGLPRDSVHAWRDTAFGVAQATLHVTAESLIETLPLVNDAGRVIAGDIRLDNRDALFEALAVPHHRRAATGDGALVLAAYDRWGADCADRLLGDFAYLIWDSRARRLVCSTDAYAMRRFHHWFDGRRFIVASRPLLILAVPGVPKAPNLANLDWTVDVAAVTRTDDESWYAGIHSAPGATTIIVDGGKLHQSRYWQPRAGTPLKFSSDADYREAFQEVFFESVRCRLRSNTPVTAMLSGGLDSSSIVAVAAKVLERENRQLDVLAVVLPDATDPVLKDERSYIDLFHAFPNVRINYIHANGQGPFSDVDALDWNAGAGHTSRHYNYTAMAQRCEELGSRVLLDGCFGEFGATTHVAGFHAELFLGLRWVELLREIRANSALTDVPTWQQFKRHVIKPLLPKQLRRRIANRRDVNIGGFDIYNPAFAAAARSRIARSGMPAFDLDPGVSHRACQLEMLRFCYARGIGSMSPPGPLEYRYPFLDKRLLQFCLDAPMSYKYRDGRPRSLVRIGLDGILPREIQLRTTKMGFSPDYMRRYNRQADEAVRFLEAVGADDPVRQVVDIDKVLTYARTNVADDEVDNMKVQDVMHRVPMAVYAITWLRQFPAFRG